VHGYDWTHSPRFITTVLTHQLKALVPLIAVFLIAGCATTQPSAYEKAAALPTPDTLLPNSRWAIVLLDANGDIAGDMVVQLSSVPVKTCDSGNYRSVDVISERRSENSIPLSNPAYEVEGAALRIELTTGWCDDGYAIVGGVTKVGGFEGIHMPEVLISPRSKRIMLLRAFGVPIPN
jgi:hypothetical protein